MWRWKRRGYLHIHGRKYPVKWLNRVLYFTGCTLACGKKVRNQYIFYHFFVYQHYRRASGSRGICGHWDGFETWLHSYFEIRFLCQKSCPEQPKEHTLNTPAIVGVLDFCSALGLMVCFNVGALPYALISPAHLISAFWRRCYVKKSLGKIKVASQCSEEVWTAQSGVVARRFCGPFSFCEPSSWGKMGFDSG